jgi:outer membrane protein OmpA-like peptidoglycan-associated protein
MQPLKQLLPLLLLSSLSLKAQNKKSASTDSSKTATVQVNLTNFSNKPIKGEQVNFLAKNSKKLFFSRTNALGKASIALPAGDIYMVTIKAMADTSKYGELEIAALGEGQFYSDPFTVNIQYEAPKNFTLNHVYFDVNKATLTPASNKELQELYEYLKWKEEVSIEIAGHTDNVGKDADNLKLSQQRAEAVKNYLIKKGIAATRLTAKGYGATVPVADNSTSEGKQKNRRTEVKVL